MSNENFYIFWHPPETCVDTLRTTEVQGHFHMFARTAYSSIHSRHSAGDVVNITPVALTSQQLSS